MTLLRFLGIHSIVQTINMISTLAVASLLGQQSRFDWESPLSLPPIKIHHLLAKTGIAQSEARRQNLQARILWVDATANLGRYNTVEKINDLCRDAKEIGFNTLVFDVKPIGGYTVYPSKFSEQLTEWRGEKLTPGFDPLRHMVEAAKREKLTLLVSLNAFSEGHSYSKRDFGKADNQFFKPGWGYDHPELQTVRRINYPALTANGDSFRISAGLNPATYDPGVELGLYQKVPTASDLTAFAEIASDGTVLSVSTSKPVTLKSQFILASKSGATDAIQNLQPGQKVILHSESIYVPIGEIQNQIPLMMNPHLKANQNRALDFARELTENYRIDGLLYDDRLRFGGIDADFSPSTLKDFASFINRPSIDPNRDIYSAQFHWSSTGITSGFKPGTHFDDWLAFRAGTMQKFVNRVGATVKKNQKMFGIYAGSWYGDYPKYGTNYASPDLTAGFPFLTTTYKKTGFADSLDLLITGAYYKQATVMETLTTGIGVAGRTVEAAGILTNRIANDEAWAVTGIMLADFYDKPERVQDALQAAAATTQGVMVFDRSHDFDRFRPILTKAFQKPAVAPYQVPNLLTKIRSTKADRKKRGFPTAPFPFFEGAPNTGF